MTLLDYIYLFTAFFLALQYNKLIDRQRMYKRYYEYAVHKMEKIGIDPVELYDLMSEDVCIDGDEELAKEVIEDAFLHYFRCRGVKIENLKIYWNE